MSKGRFEKTNVFRKGLSLYDMVSNKIDQKNACFYDQKNCSGVPLDYDPNLKKLYVDGSDAHTLLVGATGSKKSRLVVMPTVRTMAASGEGMVICDPKGEIYRRTASFLEDQGYEIHAINLREPEKGDGWNILEIPYGYFCKGKLDKACELINDATISLMPITDKDPYWDYSARDMLFGLVLLLFQLGKDMELPSYQISMMGVLKLREELFYSSYSSDILRSSIWKYAKKHSIIRTRLNGIVICPDKTLSCIISVFDQHMSCFSLQPRVMEMLSASTFSIDSLGFKRKAVFLIVPDEKTTYHKIISIFTKLIYERLIDMAFHNTSENRFPVRVNFILDEFSSLPQIPDFPQMISASRSRNIRFILVVQSKHQLMQRYRQETETIMSNCMNWMFLTSRETTLLEDISKLGGVIGDKSEKLISVSWLQHLNKEKGECLIFSGRKYPYIAQLPDIDIYDNKQFIIKNMATRQSISGFSALESETYFSDLINHPPDLW